VIRIDAHGAFLEPGPLRQALRGEDPELSPARALGLLSDPDLDIPQRTELLAEAVLSPDRAAGVRAMALRVLATVDPARALGAARDVGGSEDSLTSAAALTIGLLGGEDDRVPQDRPEGAGPSPGVRFGAVLLAHRYGRTEGALDVTAFDLVSASRGASERFVGSPAGAIASARVTRAAQQRVPWLEAPSVTEVVCGGRTLNVVTTGRLRDAAARRELTERPTVAGVIATESPGSERISVGLFILTRPTAEGQVAIVICRSEGQAVYAGAGSLSGDDSLSAELSAVRGPGVSACSIRALASASGLEVFGTADRTSVGAPLVPARRPEADPPSANRRPDEQPPR
jgi:hypothetical protein